MTMTIPTIPTMPAGYVATPADMNNLAYAVQFLLTKPIARIHDTAGTQAITTSSTPVTFGAADFDPDGMWSAATPTRLTIQTPGFYKVTYMVQGFISGTTTPLNSNVQATTGPGNPAGSGITTPCWPGYGGGNTATGNRVCARASGVIPWYQYAGDYVTVNVISSAAGQVLSITMVPSYLCLELVSI